MRGTLCAIYGKLKPICNLFDSMREYIERINRNVLHYFSVVGLVITGGLLIFSFSDSVNYRAVLSIPIGLFAYLFLIANKVSAYRTNSFSINIFIISFILLSIIDFSYEHYYEKNDWKTCKGYIYDLESRTTKHGPGIIYYNFDVNNKKIKSEKPISVMVNFGFRKRDSIYVVYSLSSPDVNDIYSIKSEPKLNDRNNIVFYTIKNSAIIKWTALLTAILIVLKYLKNRNKDRYPI
jgi:hypothetical protein